MTRRKNTLLRLTTIIVLALMMLFSVVSPAVAAPPSWEDQGADGGYLEGTESDPADAYITKLLRMASTLVTPSVEFWFSVTPVGMDGAGMPTGITMPTIPLVKIAFPNVGSGLDDSNSVGSIKEELIVSDNGIFASIGPTDWPRAGVYQYKVKEIPNTYPAHRGDDYTEIMTYSGAEYDIEVWVVPNAAGTGFFAKYIAARLVLNKIDSYWDGEAPGYKINPEEEAGGFKSEVITGDYSQMVFTNIYSKYDGEPEFPPPPDPPPIEGDTVLKIQKLVAGMGSDRNKYFDFEVTVTYTSVITVPPGHVSKVYLVEGNVIQVITKDTSLGAEDGNVPFDSDIVGILTDADGQTYIEFTPGTMFTVRLKHGQYLAFTTAPIGALYEVTDVNGVAGYMASAVKTLVSGTQITYTETATDLTVDGIIGDKTSITEPDSVVFTNRFATSTPTGITLDNLPYYALIGVAVLALATYVVLKVRKRARYTAER